MNAKVDAFINRAKTWKAETRKLREIALACGLNEELKWGKPCYCHQGGNIVLIQGFKDYCGLLFFKGALVDDPDGLLVKTGPNTRIGRQIRFTALKQIQQHEQAIIEAVKSAIAVEESGEKVELDDEPLEFPEEFEAALEDDPGFREAFEALTPGRQRGYNLHFSAPKQSKTRASRIEKAKPQILAGKGLNDR